VAVSKKVNKSESIREALAANPKSSAKEIVEYLGTKGIKVQVPLVYFIKSKSRHKQQKQKRANIAASYSSSNPITLIRGIRKLATEAGGIVNLKKFVDALAD
jgi:hypothetical protein